MGNWFTKLKKEDKEAEDAYELAPSVFWFGLSSLIVGFLIAAIYIFRLDLYALELGTAHPYLLIPINVTFFAIFGSSAIFCLYSRMSRYILMGVWSLFGLLAIFIYLVLLQTGFIFSGYQPDVWWTR